MDVQFGDDKKGESLITRVTVINPHPDPVLIPQKYRCLFHGDTEVTYGRHVFRFPIDNLGYKRLVSSFQSDFMKRLVVDFGALGIDEV